LMHAYGDNILYLDADLEIERGDKIALLGPNGCGKSTLLRLLIGKEKPMEGTVCLGEHNIKPAYFEQNQAEALDKNKTVLATIADDIHNWKDTEIRGLLGRFLFSDDSVYKKVSDLSGGEKARLAMAKLLTTSANFLILDEPTNHLDIPAKETLETAIQKFDGAVVIVSHDRYFISKVANKIIEIKDNGFKIYDGDYDYYLDRIEKEKEAQLALEQESENAIRQAAKREKRLNKEQARKQARKDGKVQQDSQ
ncbi:MAG: ATP-binding cassette domain-containing protein, partial [Candidatus Obscuribacterales bacterium]|nr:ATP-binding cassette domain-containing protein [Candidatus Obscuribacterales bacterium]